MKSTYLVTPFLKSYHINSTITYSVPDHLQALLVQLVNNIGVSLSEPYMGSSVEICIVLDQLCLKGLYLLYIVTPIVSASVLEL